MAPGLLRYGLDYRCMLSFSLSLLLLKSLEQNIRGTYGFKPRFIYSILKICWWRASTYGDQALMSKLRRWFIDTVPVTGISLCIRKEGTKYTYFLCKLIGQYIIMLRRMELSYSYCSCYFTLN